MKRIVKSFALLAVAASALVSCKGELTTPEENPQTGKFEYTFTLGAPETKALLASDSEGYFAQWEVGDKLGIYTLNNAAETTNNTAADIDISKNPVEFKVVTSYALDERSEVYAYFPYDAENSTAAAEDPSKVVLSIPASQTGSLNAMPMAAKPYAVTKPISVGTEPIADIKMRNLGSILNFNVFSSVEAYRSETVSSIAFTTETPLCGSFTYDIMEAELADITGYEGTTVTVTKNITPGNDRNSGNTVPMVVAPNATAGYKGTIVVTTNVATYTYTISSPIKIDRSIIKKVNVDLGSANAVRQEMDKVVTVTYNFNNRNQFPDGFPTSNDSGSIDATEFVISGNNIIIKASESYYIFNSTTPDCGLLFGKSASSNSVPTDATSYLEFPAKSGYRIGKIIATTTGAVAGNVEINIFDSEWNAVSTSLKTTSATSTEMPFSLTSPIINTPYRLAAVTSGKNLQFRYIVVKYYLGDYTPAADPLSIPTGLTSDHIEQTTAKLSWTAVSGASSYTVKIGETEYPGINTSSYTTTGLTPSTSYNWTVKAVGDGINYSDSDYASIESFTTADEEAGAFFYETFGVPTGNTNVTDFEGWSETGVEYSGSARVGITQSNICSLDGSSASGYMYVSSATIKQFHVAGINTSKYDNIALSINYKGSNTSAKWQIEYSTDGINYTTGASNISCTTTWKSYDLSTKLPSCENLRLRITNTATNYGVFFDDLKLFGDIKKQLTAIEVSGTPTKTTYIDGEAFDPAGLVVKACYDKGPKEEITEGIVWNVPQNLTAGTTSVDVTATALEMTSAVYTVTDLTVNTKPHNLAITPNDRVTLNGLAGSTQTVTVTSNYAWTAGKDAESFTLAPANGDGDGSLTITAVNNGSSEDTRLGTLTVTDNTDNTVTRSVEVWQRAYSSGFTVTWMSNGSKYDQTLCSTGKLELPTEPTLLGYTFRGWTKSSSINSDGSGISYASAGESVTDDVTYYAVFSKSTTTTLYEYTNSSSLTSGKTYIFVDRNTAGSGHALNSTTLPTSATANVDGSSVTAVSEGGKIVVKSIKSDIEFTSDGTNLKIGNDATQKFLVINGSGIGAVTSNYKSFYGSNGLYGTNSGGTKSYYVKWNSQGSKFQATTGTTSRVYAFEKKSSTVTTFSLTAE